LADNTQVIDELQKLFKKEAGLKNKLDEALQKIYMKEIKSGNRRYENYYIRFLDTEIRVPESYDANNNHFDKEKTIKAIMDTRFYKMIVQL
jgi:hypothetical protein